MARPEPTYDLMLLLDPVAADDVRAKALADVDRIIRKGGEVVGDHDWGTRTMAYEIDHQTDAQYRLVQFKGPAEVLSELERTLRIADGVVRFRIIKLAPGTPEPTVPQQVATPAAGEEGHGHDVAAPVEVHDDVAPAEAEVAPAAPEAEPEAAEPEAAEPAEPAPAA